MKHSPVLSVHLGARLKRDWQVYCSRNQLTPSAAIKQVINYLLTKMERESAIEQVGEVDGSKVRIEIKLTTSELEKVKSCADKTGYSQNQWIANLVRSYLTKAPQFGMRELEVLSESNLQLLRIGRNLNQLTRQINTNLAEADSLKVSDIEQLSNDISAHVRSVSSVIQANIERWKLK